VPHILHRGAHELQAETTAAVLGHDEHVAEPRHVRAVGHHTTEADEVATAGVDARSPASILEPAVDFGTGPPWPSTPRSREPMDDVDIYPIAIELISVVQFTRHQQTSPSRRCARAGNE
jgi:hypothetical protein